tara:strand:+ start:713 stop:1975 length:1263 start_codon:yes stop_codon:yes gene_type:complete
MSCNLQLQRNSKVFFSTIDINGGAAVGDMTPGNTWQIEVLAGYAVSQATATQDITPLESGTTPDRSSTRFNTALNPVDWNFQTYVRPTGSNDIDANNHGGTASSNVAPVADWQLWQALFNNQAPATSTKENSAWQDGGSYDTGTRVTSANVAAHNANFGSAQENHLYIQMDNVYYQVTSATVNEATLDAAIDSIATTTWTGFGSTLTELTSTKRNNAVSVFGGTLNDGTSVTANSSFHDLANTSSFHPWETYNVAGTSTTADFIKNKLSTISLFHTPDGGSASEYTFPITSLNWTYTNNIVYLTPEELNSLNNPIGNFAGVRQVSGSVSAYLKHDTDESAQFFRNILADTRVSHSTAANANIIVGGATAPYFSMYMPAVQFQLPVHAVEDIISVNIEYMAQEPSDSCGNGGEVQIFVGKS